MNSMTGFGFNEYSDEDFNINIEVKSYNNRFLDVNLALPPYLGRLEDKIRQEITGRLKRGRIELFIKVKNFNEETEIVIDKKGLEAHVQALRELTNLAGLHDELHLSHLLRIEGLLKTYRTFDYEKYWDVVQPVLVEALEQLVQSRMKEGEKIAQDIGRMIDSLDKEVNKIEQLVPDIEKKVTQTVRQKFNDILGKDIDETRILAEIAALLIRFDINEEVMRLKTHVTSFSSHIDTQEPVGKKLDFICQELNREINTISAKSLIIEMNNAAIIIKELIERIREQLRNVE